MKYVIGFVFAGALGGVAFIPSIGSAVYKLTATLPILLSVLLGAVFIRLARGFPAIPYEKISQSQALLATQAYRALVKSYALALVIFIVAICTNLVTNAVYGVDFKAVPGLIVYSVCALNFSVLVAVCWIVISDYTISMIQADLIDSVTAKNAGENAKKTGSEVSKAFNKKETPSITTFD